MRVCFLVFMIFIVSFFSSFVIAQTEPSVVFVEAESFTDKGGWVVDNQSMMQMGSPYLMAHGLGVPVQDAAHSFIVPQDGQYKVWVRTRDWVKTWKKDGSPGRFEILFNGQALNVIFGTEQADWHWQDGGTVELNAGNNQLSLHDLTGFNGRCDAIYLTTNLNEIPPNNLTGLERFRRQKLQLPEQPEDMGEYDFVVTGGGIAGCCAAISAARLGCKVALIQNRPVLGGNNSSEVRVGLSGKIAQQPYPRLGNLLDELGGVGYWTNWESQQNPNTERSRQIAAIIQQHPEKKIHNAGPASNYEDDKKEQLVRREKNITLFLNTQVVEVEKSGNRITSIIGKHILTGKSFRYKANLFADCTGDGVVGYLAGADYRMGRESQAETGEPHAPEKADQLVMGTSVQWYAVTTKEQTTFPECSWAVAFNEQTCQPILRGDWDWETGLNKNQIEDIESIRDHALRTVFGNWDFLKNKSNRKSEFANKKLEWAAYIGGKRESRRLLGDVILKEQEILNKEVFEDASFTTTWGIDLHYPKPIKGMEEEAFLSYADVREIKPFAVPYRCLYSRNIDNLLMAGRNISVTHVTLGTVRVMRTGGMMGEVIGMAASLCKKHHTNPRQIYQSHLPELKELMKQGTGVSGFEKISEKEK